MRDNNRQVKLLYLGTNGSVEKSIIFPESKSRLYLQSIKVGNEGYGVVEPV